MERNMSQSSALCQSGCGFYGNPATDGFCSKCYKDMVMRKQAVPASAPAAAPCPAPVSEMSSSTSSPPLLPLKPPTASALEAHLNTATPTVTSFPAVSAQLSPKSEVAASGTDGSSSGIRNQQDGGTGSSSNVVSASSATPSPAGSLKDGLQCPPVPTEPPLSATAEAKKKGKNRCSVCKIKVGVIGFPCRCGGTFCSVHRYANEHACSFDYREHGQEEIRKNNPQIVGEKIQKI